MVQYRLGFPVKVLGAPLPSHDSRRWQNRPHLSVSLAYLRDIFEYLHRHDIRFYRMAGQLAPYLTHPDLPDFRHQLEECAVELAALGDLARAYRLRLTLHPAFYVQLGSPDPGQVQRSVQELDAAAALLDAMGLDEDGVVVIHVGGTFGDPEATRARFAARVNALRPATRRRLALENGDRHHALDASLWIHRRTGIRLVLDLLHHRCLNPAGYPVAEALTLALATWPPGQRPKIHFSTPRTALRRRILYGQEHLQFPLVNQHSDFLNPFEFIDFLRLARQRTERAFDIMLEAKGKDLALLRLREQLRTYAPDLAPLVG